jgi:CRISPR-associated protein Cmr4
LPKIPGTSLSGAIRSYAAYRYGKRECAGQGVEKERGKGHCGQLTCPICYTFGSIKGDNANSGVVSIGDARLLLFPVYSMVGPVWVTSPSALQDFGIEDESVEGNKAKWNGVTNQGHLNLGWLMVEKNDGDWEIPEKLPGSVRNRTVLISDKLFSQVVNSNLEVRTSVSINPETGAAEDKALFTYEAIPRAAFLWMDAVVDDYRKGELWKNGGIIWKAHKEETRESSDEIKITWHDNYIDGMPLYPDSKDSSKPEQINGVSKGWKSPEDVILAGLEWTEHLGIGGMGTRGFGRMRVVYPSQSHSQLQTEAQREEGRTNGS